MHARTITHTHTHTHTHIYIRVVGHSRSRVSLLLFGDIYILRFALVKNQIGVILVMSGQN